MNRLQCLHVYFLHSHTADILQSRFIDLYVDFEQDKKLLHAESIIPQ